MAMVDHLAEILSKETGSTFVILRGRVEGEMRYGLKIVGGDGPQFEFSRTFQAHRPMRLNDLTCWLASLCDMIQMGFIPVRKD